MKGNSTSRKPLGAARRAVLAPKSLLENKENSAHPQMHAKEQIVTQANRKALATKDSSQSNNLPNNDNYFPKQSDIGSYNNNRNEHGTEQLFAGLGISMLDNKENEVPNLTAKLHAQTGLNLTANPWQDKFSREDGLPYSIGWPIWTRDDVAEVENIKKEYVEVEFDEEDDISMVREYSDEIFTYMLILEERLAPNPRLLEIQSEIKPNMRCILIDWVVQVHSRFRLLAETLFLTVNIIDRFLSYKNKESLSRFQLLGATALFIASKYEEIHSPSIAEIEYMLDGAFDKDEILNLEQEIVRTLEFNFGWPGPMSFLRKISRADDYDVDTRTLAKYFLDVMLMENRFIGALPSFMAASAHCLARKFLRKGEWTAGHIFYSGYTSRQLEPAISGLMECLYEPKKHHAAVYQKYAEKKFKKASIFVENWFRM